MASEPISATITDMLANDPELHVPGSPGYERLETELRREFADRADRNLRIGTDLEIKWPYRSFGKIDSNDLLILDTFISYAFYLRNTSRYNTVFDIGANVGLHSIVLSKLGYNVIAFEPDTNHVPLLKEALELNGAHGVQVLQKAVAPVSGKSTFVRVDDNTTSSHLKGMKSPYGALTEFEVETISLEDVGTVPDLIKLDAEGAEGQIIPSIPPQWWSHTDVFAEIHGDEAAALIFEYSQSQGIGMFAQRLAWRAVTDLSQVPTHHTHGSVFMTHGDGMPWGKS